MNIIRRILFMLLGIVLIFLLLYSYFKFKMNGGRKSSSYTDRNPVASIERKNRIQITKETDTSITFWFNDGFKKPKKRTYINVSIVRNNIKSDLETFTPNINCIECELPHAKYELINGRVFVSLNNIPKDHRDECIDTLISLLESYVADLEKRNK